MHALELILHFTGGSVFSVNDLQSSVRIPLNSLRRVQLKLPAYQADVS